MKKLTHIGLSETSFTDAGLVHLSKLPELVTLSRFREHVADAGILDLSHLGNLDRLEIDATDITEAGSNHFRKAIPNAGLHWSPPDKKHGPGTVFPRSGSR